MNRITFVALTTFSTFSLLSTSALSATKIGVVGAADKTVRIVSVDGKERIVKLGDDIFANDTIKTDGDGKAQLIFKDRSTVTINENSELKIDKFIYNPAQDSGEMAMQNVKGAFRFIGGALSKKKPVQIKTPVATIGIRGGIVDTKVGQGGQTDAVFLFGEEMSMTNADGVSNVTTDYGTGFTLSDASTAPTALPRDMVSQSIAGFTHMQSRGGGAAVVPTSQDVAPALELNTQAGQPLPLPTPSSSSQAPTAPAASAPAPQANAQPRPATADGGRVEVSSESREITMREAAQDPQQLRRMVDDESIANAYMENEQFRDAMIESITSDGVISDDEAAFVNDVAQAVGEAGGDAAAVLLEVATTIDAPDTPRDDGGFFGEGGVPIASIAPNDDDDAEFVPQPLAKPVSDEVEDEVAAAPQTGDGVRADDRSGRFVVVDRYASGTAVLRDRGALEIDADAGKYRVSLEDGGEYVVSKLSKSGYSANISADVMQVVDGEEVPLENASVSGYRTNGGALELYRIREADRDVIFSIGRNIFQETTGTDAWKAAAANSAESQQATNGVVLYDYVPVLDNSSAPYGAFDYDQNRSAPAAAIDWSEGGATGKLFKGQLQWLKDEHGRSYAIAGYGRPDGSPSADNERNIAGQAFSFVTGMAGNALSRDDVSSLELFDFSIGGEIYANEGGVVEGAVVDYEPAADSVLGGLGRSFTGSAGEAGQQALVVRTPDSAQRDAIANASDSTGTKLYGFSAGVVMEYDDGTYEPKLYATRDRHAGSEEDAFGVRIRVSDDGSAINRAVIKLRGVEDRGDRVKAVFDNPQQSVYINDGMYAAQQTTVYNKSENGVASTEGVLLSAGSGQAQDQIPDAYVCNDCEFVHWGVWAANLGPGDGQSRDDYANLIPYVAGDVTQGADLRNVTEQRATYKGEAYATVFVEGFNPQNVAGKMDATAQLGGNQATVESLSIDFGDVAGAPLDMRIEDAARINTGEGAAHFSQSLEAGARLGARDGEITGNIAGALFGPTGEEIGGRTTFERSDAGRDLQGGGIFFGKQR